MAQKKRFLLRVDPEIHAAVERWAADELRSVNAQIEFLLRRALVDAKRDPKAPARALPSDPGEPEKED